MKSETLSVILTLVKTSTPILTDKHDAPAAVYYRCVPGVLVFPRQTPLAGAARGSASHREIRCDNGLCAPCERSAPEVTIVGRIGWRRHWDPAYRQLRRQRITVTGSVFRSWFLCGELALHEHAALRANARDYANQLTLLRVF